MTDTTDRYRVRIESGALPVAVSICLDCGALVADTRQHDRWHLALSTSGHVPVVRADGTIRAEDTG